MASSPILDALGALMTPDVMERASAHLGESEAATSQGLGAAFAALLSALLRRSDEPGTMDRLYALIDDPANQPSSVLADLGRLLSGGASTSAAAVGSQFLAALFGDRTSSLASALARYAGVRPASGSSLLAAAAPLLMAVLRDHSRRDGLGASGLARWLGGQRGAIDEHLPPAIASVLAEARRGRSPAPPPPPVRARSQGRSWLWPALIGLALLGGLWSLLRSGEPDVRRARSVAAAPPTPVAGPLRVKLPDGAELGIQSDSLEDRLLTMLKDPSRPLDWIDFDRLLFETDSARLRPESRAQLVDIAAILAAYPNARVKVGGYTDNQGDPAHNLGLSEQRAANVARELAALGVDRSRIASEGYGEQHPVAPNDTEEGRARNRRTALLVTSR